MYAGHLDLTCPIWWTVEEALDAETCRALIARMDASAAEAEVAPIHGKDGKPTLDEAVRSNTRIMFPDAQLTALMFSRLYDTLPQALKGRRLHSVNDWWRIYRYGPGQRHGMHWDTPVELDAAISELTLVIYLNDDFEGGRTLFNELDGAVDPAPGRALLFQQRVLHEAEPVLSGAKYVLRSEIMYAC